VLSPAGRPHTRGDVVRAPILLQHASLCSVQNAPPCPADHTDMGRIDARRAADQRIVASPSLTSNSLCSNNLAGVCCLRWEPHTRSRRRPGLEPTLDFMRLLWRIEHGSKAGRSRWRLPSHHGAATPRAENRRPVPRTVAGELANIVRLHPSTITASCSVSSTRGCSSAPGTARTGGAFNCGSPGRKPFTRRSATTIELAIAGCLRGSRPLTSTRRDRSSRPGSRARERRIART